MPPGVKIDEVHAGQRCFVASLLLAWLLRGPDALAEASGGRQFRIFGRGAILGRKH